MMQISADHHSSKAIWLVRHAQPLIATGICYGNLDIAADQAATESAAWQLAQALKARDPDSRPRCIMVSELQRAQQLAYALQSHLPQLSIQVDARLNEMDFGLWEGVAWDAIPQTEYDHWIADFANYRFGGKESCEEMIQRIRACYLESQARQNHELLWICHAGVIRALQFYLQNNSSHIRQAQDWPKNTIAFGEFIRLG
jgi:alpha-ribazole phosphatase